MISLGSVYSRTLADSNATIIERIIFLMSISPFKNTFQHAAKMHSDVGSFVVLAYQITPLISVYDVKTNISLHVLYMIIV